MSPDLTTLIEDWRNGVPDARDRVIELTYAELRRLAGAQLGRERPGHTLQPTALVNEALLRLLGRAPAWENRRHFFGAAARAMRQVLVDHARRRAADKRGGGAERVELGESLAAAPHLSQVDLLALEGALQQLEGFDPLAVQVVELRFLAGFSIEETAAVLELHPSAVNREWAAARAWLKKELLGR